MLPNLYYQCYQKLSELLKGLQQTAIASEMETTKLRQDVLAAQQYFQQQIASLDRQEIDPAIESRVRSLSTEISKQLNLLNMDVTFLQAARQPQTLQTRQQQIVQRLQTLVSYCEAILVLDKGDKEDKGD
jgi:Zn-dependent oligopeptidase